MAQWPYSTARWQRLRKAHLSLEPLCRACAPRLVLADTVDHVVAISDGGPAFPGHDGLTSYCTACHSAKTARGAEAGAARTNKPRRGCDAAGNPLDPAHNWSKQHREAPQRNLANDRRLADSQRRSLPVVRSIDGHGKLYPAGDSSGDVHRRLALADAKKQEPEIKSLKAGALGACGVPSLELIQQSPEKAERHGR